MLIFAKFSAIIENNEKSSNEAYLDLFQRYVISRSCFNSWTYLEFRLFTEKLPGS